MSNARITSAEVALRAGVSQSAVSRVFTPGASASPSTVERVKKAANELGYRPNSLARAMVSGKSRIIGLVPSPPIADMMRSHSSVATRSMGNQVLR